MPLDYDGEVGATVLVGGRPDMDTIGDQAVFPYDYARGFARKEKTAIHIAPITDPDVTRVLQPYVGSQENVIPCIHERG
jgi:hypothetical protein